MASNSFRGIEVFKNYKWGYVCEHCGKTVEKCNNITIREGANYKSSSWTYISPVDLNRMVEAAKMKFPAIGVSLKEKWDKGIYPEPITEDSLCPFCEKHQHWDKKLVNFSSASTGTGLRVFTSLVFAFIASGALWLLIYFFSRNSLVSSIISCVALAVIFILTFISMKKEDEQLLSDSEALKGLDKTNPYFMDWQDTGYKNIGLTVR